MKLSTLAFLLSALLFSGCVGPAHDAAETIAPACPGYRQHNQCEPWAREFKQRMAAQGHEVTLVGITWTKRGETVNHLVTMWLDSDGWWARDNLRGPTQVDSFRRYTWATRIENFLSPMGLGGAEIMPSGNYTISNVRVVK